MTVLGLTFKENVPDIRNSRVVDIVRTLESFGVNVQIHDPYASPEKAHRTYQLPLTGLHEIAPSDAVIIAVGHRAYVEEGWTLVKRLLKNGGAAVLAVRSILNKADKPDGMDLWRL